uniref:ephrin type-A receptor 5-like isoform X2 n=1 Tax=Ciona intestinalis TaxID=7719 RepID=UPI00089DC01E|nr:ephrin type-A receptor 5-like isoform X2 [Ciona intestinalis]|eukprot:XP_018668009.1 ephrin type-A receptor 5-like isoform X2 [Ciona intestinalis]
MERFVFMFLVVGCASETMDLYNSKSATTDLKWTPFSTGIGWEEVSSYDEGHRTTIRSYQVCPQEDTTVESDNWIRSPYIDARDGKLIHLDVEFSINHCSHDTLPDNMKKTQCKETFNMFYYEADGDVATSTFPPWREKPYVKIDTIAANSVNRVNTKTFSFGPITRRGFYVSVQDQGACMSLISLQIYYFYCGETWKNLAVFPKTVSGDSMASLVEVVGSCVDHAVQSTNLGSPEYRCNSNGRWQINTGGCVCDVGFQPNNQQTRCQPCPDGTYKVSNTISECLPCPNNSGFNISHTNHASNNECLCNTGYARASGETVNTPCTAAPSSPLNLLASEHDGHAVTLTWLPPVHLGGRKDIFYKIGCKSTPLWELEQFISCSNALVYQPHLNEGKIFSTTLQISNMSPYTQYMLSIQAANGVSGIIDNYDVTNSIATVTVNTTQSTPSSVYGIETSDIEPTSATLSWHVPRYPNGEIIEYVVKLQYGGHSNTPTLVKTSDTTVHLDGLLSNTNYIVLIHARTVAGFGPFSKPISFKTLTPATIAKPVTVSPTVNVPVIAGAVCGLALVIILIVVVLRCRKTGNFLCFTCKRINTKDMEMSLDVKSDPMISERLIVDLPPRDRIYVKYPNPQTALAKFKCEINPSAITIEDVIGSGEFAEVCCGRLVHENKTIKVAVKRLKDSATSVDETNFLQEGVTLTQFDDANVVKIQGVVTSSPNIMIVFEYMENGALDKYLQLHKNDITLFQLLEMLRGIASGMKYLSSMKYVHRDLAARNILVNSQLVCKVSDFGLSRTLENDPQATYTTQGGKIAIRWTAPESILFRQFTSASDVWSYGIVMWEVMSYGEKPYWDMSNKQVMESIQKGMRLPSPMNCPKPLHDLMLECWFAEVKDRPSFLQIFQKLNRLLRDWVEQPVASVASKPTPRLHRDITNVQQWLDKLCMSEYSETFNENEIKNLHLVSTLTASDLKAMGISNEDHKRVILDGVLALKRRFAQEV